MIPVLYRYTFSFRAADERLGAGGRVIGFSFPLFFLVYVAMCCSVEIRSFRAECCVLWVRSLPPCFVVVEFIRNTLSRNAACCVCASIAMFCVTEFIQTTVFLRVSLAKCLLGVGSFVAVYCACG